MQVKVSVTVHCPSICLSIGLSVPSWSAAGLLLWAGRQEISIDYCSGSLRWAESWTQSCINWPLFCKVMGNNMVDFLECPVFFLHQPALSALTLLGIMKSIRPIKIEWWGVGIVICLEQGADCVHMILLKPLHPKTTSLALFKSRLVLPFWYQLTLVVLEKWPVKRVQ